MPSLRSLPSVDQVLRAVNSHGWPHDVVAGEIRRVLDERRNAIQKDELLEDVPVHEVVDARLRRLAEPSLRPVINATGVILHTNLGRAPLPAFEPIQGYSNLEYDLASGNRGKRDVHTSSLLERLLGRPAIVVNNNAAAVFLALHELSRGQEVLVSRGELVEIGDGFRIPEIMALSGCILREVGATNRTRIEDYRGAIGPQTRLILRVHPSNFQISGFTARPTLGELADLAKSANIPFYEDLGSGCLMDLSAIGLREPLVSESLAAGANLVSFSCDKLMGGPQSGILAGDAALIARLRRNPLYRTFRADKLIVQALETLLRHLLMEDWNAIPALRMMMASTAELKARAERIASHLRVKCAIHESEAPIGGGSTPNQALPSWIVELNVNKAHAWEGRLRAGSPPVVARIEQGKVVLDMRTISEPEVELLIRAVNAIADTEA